MFKCAFLGCGPRARGHARAYEFVKRGQKVAICDMNEERLNQFGDEFGVATRYTDLHQMLDTEKPDVLHIVTLPELRVELMTIAADHGVPGVIVEKPIALQGEDWRALRDLDARSKTKYCVNTQLHFHAQNLDLKQTVAEGTIGEVRHIDASARSTPLDQGVHVLELAHSYTGFDDIVSVFGQVADGSELDSRQPSPAMATGMIGFASGVRASLTCGACAPIATDRVEVRYAHKRVAAYGTDGFTHWTMSGWERRTVDGGYERGSHDYGAEDDLAQARLTEAMFDWLLDDAQPHPTRLERSLAEFNAILGLYLSALGSRPVDLPCDPPDGLLDSLRARLCG
ncbi:MAG: Gfo/Idh/MocA family oxidoreductase [Armatimonadetes bacterium]|nr:Gfo/Idh/MocA family oxidoreductase [Armatimonadota bacterium]